MGFPDTRAGMEAAGYRRRSYSRCVGCKIPIEWWLTPAGKLTPMDAMKDGESIAVSHFATCPQASQFRKGKRK